MPNPSVCLVYPCFRVLAIAWGLVNPIMRELPIQQVLSPLSQLLQDIDNQPCGPNRWNELRMDFEGWSGTLPSSPTGHQVHDVQLAHITETSRTPSNRHYRDYTTLTTGTPASLEYVLCVDVTPNHLQVKTWQKWNTPFIKKNRQPTLILCRRQLAVFKCSAPCRDYAVDLRSWGCVYTYQQN